MNQCIEVALVLITDIAAESGSLFAVEHHQFGERGGFADRLSVTGNRLFGLGHRHVLIPYHVRPEPAASERPRPSQSGREGTADYPCRRRTDHESGPLIPFGQSSRVLL